MAKKPFKNSSGSTSNLTGGENLKFPKLIDDDLTLQARNSGSSQPETNSPAAELEISDKSGDGIQVSQAKDFNPQAFYFLSKKETIFSAIASGLLILFTVLLTVSAQVYKPTKSDIKTYGKNVASILKTSAYEHAVLWAVIAIFMFVATFWIKRRAPIIVAAVLASFALGLITPYGLIYIALAGVVGYNAYKVKQNTPKDSRPQRMAGPTGSLFRKKKSESEAKTEGDIKKSIPKPNSRYTPPKSSGKKK